MSDFDDNWQIVGAIPGFQPADNTPEVQPAAPAAPVQRSEPQAPVVLAQPFDQPGMTQNLAAPAEPQPQAFVPAAQAAPEPQPVAVPFSAAVTQNIPAAPAPAQPQYQQVYQPQMQPSYPNAGYAQVPQQMGMPMYGGYVQQSAFQQNMTMFAADRDKNLNECNRMINHFSPKIDVYQNYERCFCDISKYSRTSKAPLIWGIILGVVTLGMGYTAFTSKYKNTIITNSIITGVFLLASAGLITLFVLKKKGHAKKIDALFTTLGELSTELNLIYNGYSNCVLPPEFTDPRILYKIQSLILSGRCVTINNALNAILSYSNTYMRINDARTKFENDTAERFDGKPVFFNAARYMNLR